MSEQKEILTLDETCSYTGFSKSLIYKLTSQSRIPHYKPLGSKKIFFDKSELISWLKQNRVTPTTDTVIRAATHAGI